MKPTEDTKDKKYPSQAEMKAAIAGTDERIREWLHSTREDQETYEYEIKNRRWPD